MKAQTDFPLVIDVQPLNGKKLRVMFASGIAKIYDCAPLLCADPFSALRDDFLFRNVHVEPHGHAVVWNDDLDLAESELWQNGNLESEVPAGNV